MNFRRLLDKRQSGQASVDLRYILRYGHLKLTGIHLKIKILTLTYSNRFAMTKNVEKSGKQYPLIPNFGAPR